MRIYKYVRKVAFSVVVSSERSFVGSEMSDLVMELTHRFVEAFWNLPERKPGLAKLGPPEITAVAEIV